MSISRFFLGLMLTLSIVVFAGCVDNSDPTDMPALPRAEKDYEGPGLAYDNLTGPGDWSSNPNDLDGTGAGGSWAPADPNDNMGLPVIYFAFDSDELIPSEAGKLDRVASFMNGDAAGYGLIVEGHCDQRGTEEYNRALGERRANAIRAYLVTAGLNDSRMRTISYGKDRPQVDGSGESIWRQNRRGVLVPAHMR